MAYSRQRTEAPNGSPQGFRLTKRMQAFGVWRTLGTTLVLKLLKRLDVRTYGQR